MTDDAPAEATTNRARLMAVLRNRQVRKLQLASAGSVLGDWAYSTAIMVWAYQEGGAAAVGAYQAVRFVSMAIASPLGGVIADRVPRRTFMITCDVVRAVLVSAAAVTIGADGPSIVVYALAIIAAIVGAPFRAAQAGLLPQLVDSPSDLTAANAVAGNVEMAMMFAGPGLAGLVIAGWSVEAVVWFNAITFAWSILFLLSVRPGRPAASEEEEQEDQEPEPEPEKRSYFSDLVAGFALVARNRDLRNVSLISGSVGFAWGGLSVFMVLLAIDVLDTGPEGLGYLNSVLGSATVVGGLLILGRLSGSRLGEDMVVGSLGWALPLLVLAAFPSPVTVVACLLVIGLSEPLAGLGMETIPQRIAPSDFISRVYSAIDSALILPMSLGALLAPHLVDWLGLQPAIAISGGVILVTALALWPDFRALDRRFKAPPELDLLRKVPAFADLPASALERLAHTSERVELPAGSTVLAEGQSSDRFYVIVSGQVDVTRGGQVLRTEGPGEFFGEIGLLRNVLRTATVTATADSEFLVVERSDFLSAFGHQGDARSALEDVVVHRLYA